MALQDDDVLDPAHRDDGDHSATTVVAGMPHGGDKTPTRPEDFSMTDDGNIVTVGGKRYITDAALAAERGKNKQLSDALAQLDPLMPQFEQFLKTQSNRRDSVRDTVAHSGADSEDTDEYLGEVATALGYYDEQNQPDLRRAKAHLAVTRKEAERTANRAVAPVTESTRKEIARANRERALSATFVDGQPIADNKYMQEAFSTMSDEQLADPNVANLTQVIAAGLQFLDQRRNGTLGRGRRGGEPNFREGGRGRFDDGDTGLSDMDRAAARARGKSPEEWAKLQGRVAGKDNRNNVMEQL